MSQATKVSGQEDELKKIQYQHFPTDQWDMYQYQGFWYPCKFLKGIISVQENFKAQNTDIVLCSFPKTGTTWLKALTFAITTKHRYSAAATYHQHNPLLTRVPHDCIPFLEVDLAVFDQDDADVKDNGGSSLGYNRDPQLPLLATHLPYTSLPKSIVESLPGGCKIVYLWRDPKDTFVSFWYFLKKFILRIKLKLFKFWNIIAQRIWKVKRCSN